jgi:hypothetical protein
VRKALKDIGFEKPTPIQREAIPLAFKGYLNTKNHFCSLYQMVLRFLTFYLGVVQEKKRVGRLPKVSDLQFCALFILFLISQTLPSSHWLNL